MRIRLRAVIIVLVLGSFAVVSIGQDDCSGGGSGSGSGGNGSQGSKSGKATKEESSGLTSGQENALRAAEDYLDISAFSKAGLIQQLSSPAGEGYSKADATFAANNVDADWDAEAVEAAEGYLEISSFSKDGLIEQLSSAAGDQFTLEQAQYAVNKVY